MTTEIIVGVGALMIRTAVLGGGLEIKEPKIPQVDAGPRIGAGVVGAIVLGLGRGVRTAVRRACSG